MRLDTLPTFALLALSHLSFEVAANSGYAASCNSMELLAPDSNVPCYTIDGNCAEDSGVYNVDTWLAIGRCFGNSDGKLVGQLNGGFGGSCKDMTLSGTTLSGKCANDAGTYVSTSIDMDGYIGNVDGILWCFNTNGGDCP